MSAPDRKVRHLRLRARDEAEVRSATHRLEDALRCASLPDDGGRLLLVRRLDLGRVPADISSQSLALLVERRVGECGYTWVHGAAVEAAEANAVWFHDTTDALINLAKEVTLRRPLAAAWFWRSVLPNYSATLVPARILEMMVTHAAALPTARATLAQLVAALTQIAGPGMLPTLFTPAAQRVLQAAARQLGTPGRSEHLAAAESDTRWWRSPQGDAVMLSYSMQEFAPWLPILLGAAGWTETTRIHLAGRQRPERPIEAVSERGSMGIESASPADPDLPALDKLVDSSLIPTAASARASNYSPELPSEAPPARHRETPAPAKNVSDTPPAVPAFREMHASRAAGLLFLLALLTRLGFGEWSAALSQAQAQSVAFGVLRKALRRLRVADEDPAHAMLAAWPIEALPCGPIDTPGSWRDPRIALQVPDAPDSDVLAALWLTACRRSLRRAARIGLASLVLRPGKLAWSLTHIDVYLDMRDLDLRVRRNALDIDPGWLSWLARVVSFHYEPGLRT